MTGDIITRPKAVAVPRMIPETTPAVLIFRQHKGEDEDREFPRGEVNLHRPR